MALLGAILRIDSTENGMATFIFALVMISSGIEHNFPSWNHSQYCIAREMLAAFLKRENSSLHTLEPLEV